MTLTIGRASSLRPGKGGIVVDGDRVSIKGTIVASNNAELRARRQQIRGLVDNEDEQVFPLSYAGDPTFDGYYRVRSAKVEPVGVIAGKTAAFAVDLERIPGFQTPVIEIAQRHLLMTNDHSVASANGILAISKAGHLLPAGATAAMYSRTSESGALWCFNYNTPPDNKTFAHLLPAASFYAGAATVEGLYGATWYPVVGQQIPASVGAVRLSNGLLRVTLGATGELSLAIYNGSAWESASSTFKFSVGHGEVLVDLAQPSAVRVIRNSPECCVLRVAFMDNTVSPTYVDSVSIDFVLRRGQFIVDCHWLSTNMVGARVAAVTPFAATSIYTNGYFRQTSNDANGNRLVVGGPKVLTSDLTNGSYGTTGALGMTFMVGVELDGSLSVEPNRAADLVAQHLGQIPATQRVVVR